MAPQSRTLAEEQLPRRRTVKQGFSATDSDDLRQGMISVLPGDKILHYHVLPYFEKRMGRKVQAPSDGWLWVGKITEGVEGWIPDWCLVEPQEVESGDSEQEDVEPQSRMRSRSRTPINQDQGTDHVMIDNLVFASYVLSENCDMEEFAGLLRKVSAHVAVIVCEAMDRDCDAMLEDLRWQEENLGDKALTRLFPGGYIVTNRAVCEGVQALTKWHTSFSLHGSPRFGTATVSLRAPQPDIAVGVLRIQASQCVVPSPVISELRDLIAYLEIRFLAGIFPEYDFRSKLWEMLYREGMACAPFCQPFRCDDGHLYAYPHFVAVFGSIEDITAVADEKQPTWRDYLEHTEGDLSAEDRDALFDNMHLLGHPLTFRCEKMVHCPRLGRIIQKPIGWKWLLSGTHQIILWVEGRRGARDRASAASKAKFAKRNAVRGSHRSRG